MDSRTFNLPEPSSDKVENLYLQVLIGMSCGIAVGWAIPELGVAVKPLGDIFIKLIKLLIAPIIFITLVCGIAGMREHKKIGRVGLKALVYFEVATTLALVIGLVVVNVVGPGEGMNVDVATLDPSLVKGFEKQVASMSLGDHMYSVIPDAFVGAFASGNVLQVLLLSLLFGFALNRVGEHGYPVVTVLNQVGRVFFGMVSMVTRFAPIAAFGAMGFTVGRYGTEALWSLGKLLVCVYMTCALFIILVLGGVLHIQGISLWKLVVYLKEEIWIVVGTSSSETVLPRLMQRMEELGCSRPVVGVVLPAGYSFNLDGTCIYLTMASVFIAQATNTAMNWGQQVALLAVLLITSKGAAGVTGSGFVTLAATLSSTGGIPVAGLALLVGIDRFMSEARALTNMIGNSVAMISIAKWEGEFDLKKADCVLRHPKLKTLVESNEKL